MSATASSGVTSTWYAGGNASRQIRNASTPASSPRAADERVAQVVGPGARERGELGLERGSVGDRRRVAGVSHHDVQPRHHRLGDQDGEVDRAPAERALQRVRGSPARTGVV